ncbi:PQQ-binding-like beta-propeller repeat protein [Streptomyces sp. NPDC001276]|uniref:outer membrane protein assembly factor BamB family protein n=1 Tax=Streptomyces sp. NPDC001276 TaxID=3364555 RepID=UPI0036B69D63
MSQPPSQPPQGGFGAPQDQPQQPQDQPPQPGGFGPPQTPPAQGGFGAPQDPPAQGGFGAPQDPRQATPPPPAQPPQTPTPPPAGPPQPGYGYPQQPGPYAQPGPYGAPAAPGPYGQPQQPGPYGQQPGYGYPQQPHFAGAPGTPPPGGSSSPFKGKTAAIIGAAVAAVLVAGVTVWAVSGDDGGKKPVADASDDAKPSKSAASDAPVNPGDGSGDGKGEAEDLNAGRKSGEARVLWYKEAPAAPGGGAEAPGMWITGKTAVKAAYKQVVAYNVGDGRPTWEPITFPEKICAVTPQKTADDKVVVAYMSGSSDRAKCNQLQQIDLNTGAKGWTIKVEDGELFDSTLTIEMTVAGKTLMVGRSQSGTAYDIDSGKKLFDKRRYGQACFPGAFAGGARLLSVASCGAGGSNEHDEVQELDPATGAVRWTKKIPKDWSVERVYSVDPVVLYSVDKDKKHWNISTLSGGAIRSQVDTKSNFNAECGWAILARNLQGCQAVASDADTLYLPTDVTTGANEIVALNLATGKEKWRVKSPTDTSMMPLKVENGQLIVYVEPSYDAGGQIVSVATAGSAHTPVKLLQNPEGTASIENGFYSRAVDWVDGRFYLSTTRLRGKADTKEKLMLAYGK